jgi:hypothetical protein
MLKNAIKRLFPISCIVALLMTAPGMTVLADEMQQKEVILSDNNRTVNNTNVHARMAASTTAQKWYLQ